MKIDEVLTEGEGYRFASTKYKRPGKSTRGNQWSGHAGMAMGQNPNAKLTPQQKAVEKARKEHERMLEKRAKKDLRFTDLEQWKSEIARRFLGRVKPMKDHKGNLLLVSHNDNSALYARWNRTDGVGLVWAKPRHINAHHLKDHK